MSQAIYTGLRFNQNEPGGGGRTIAEPIEVHFLWRPQLGDPADELVLEAAVNGGAKAIITHNVRDFLPAARDFGIEVLTPSELLKRIDE